MPFPFEMHNDLKAWAPLAKELCDGATLLLGGILLMRHSGGAPDC